MPDFARRLAASLRIPYVPVLRRTARRPPQKQMENSSRQAANLDGAVAVSGSSPPGPVLLLDDTVDSGWTFTVCAYLLRRAGAEAVHPLALASTENAEVPTTEPEPLSPNTQAVLLLTAPLGDHPSLSLPEYNALALQLRELQQEPAELLANPDFIASLPESPRLAELLGRAALLTETLARWQSLGIWILSRSDPAYPRRLKTRLKLDAPALLYGAGNPAILQDPTAQIIGPRDKLPMDAPALLLLGSGLERASTSPRYAVPLEQGTLAIITAADPQLPYSDALEANCAHLKAALTSS
jgi:hypothetical protein